VLALRSVRGFRQEASLASCLSFAPGFSRIAVRDGIPVSATDTTSEPGLVRGDATLEVYMAVRSKSRGRRSNKIFFEGSLRWKTVTGCDLITKAGCDMR